MGRLFRIVCSLLHQKPPRTIICTQSRRYSSPSFPESQIPAISSLTYETNVSTSPLQTQEMMSIALGSMLKNRSLNVAVVSNRDINNVKTKVEDLSVEPTKKFKSEEPFIIFITGAPGSGKGTISSYLTKEFELRTLSSGDILRTHISLGTTLGKSFENQIKNGGLVSDEVITELILNEVERCQRKGESLLLDGFPRTLAQAQTLTQHLKENSTHISLVINLDVPEEIILARLTDRWIHPASGRTYNNRFNPPKVAGKDDITGEELVRRSDDSETTVCTRLAHYHNLTTPLVKYYADQGVLQSFKGKTSKEMYPHIKLLLLDRLFSKK